MPVTKVILELEISTAGSNGSWFAICDHWCAHCLSHIVSTKHNAAEPEEDGEATVLLLQYHGPCYFAMDATCSIVQSMCAQTMLTW